LTACTGLVILRCNTRALEATVSTGKDEVITFKAGASLAQAIRRMPNRSEFIRAAILSAMDNVCPLCQGTGILTPEQKKHWVSFARDHQVIQCRDCDAVYLQCDTGHQE
jgi:hypothetical protein